MVDHQASGFDGGSDAAFVEQDRLYDSSRGQDGDHDFALFTDLRISSRTRAQ